jgi:hypothetical protein
MTARAEQAAAINTPVAGQHMTRKRSPNRGECATGPDEFTAWLTASCQRQSLPVIITDPTVLAAIAALLR